MDENAVFQHSYYIGNNFNCILYGIELVLYFASLRCILKAQKTGSKMKMFFAIFSTIMLFLVTIQVAVQSVFGEIMWISNASYPGGSEAYLAAFASIWYQTMGSGATVLLTVFSDTLLIYRCYVVWGSWKPIIIFPVILDIASLVLGTLVCYYSGIPNSDFFAGLASRLNLSWRCVAIGLNVVVSSLICFRILYVSKEMRDVFGKEAAQRYTGAVSIVTESALPYTLSGIAYVVTVGLNSPLAIFFLSVYVMFTCISPQMIILRVLMGRAWSKDTLCASTRMSFAEPELAPLHASSPSTTIALGDLTKKDVNKSHSTMYMISTTDNSSQV